MNGQGDKQIQRSAGPTEGRMKRLRACAILLWSPRLSVSGTATAQSKEIGLASWKNSEALPISERSVHYFLYDVLMRYM